MSNLNTFADVILSQNNGVPITLAATTALHQAFGATAGATGAAILTIPNPMLPLFGPRFQNRSAESIGFKIRAAGKVHGGENYVIDVNQGLALTNTVMTTGLNNLGVEDDSWYLEGIFLWEPGDLRLRGLYKGWTGNLPRSERPLEQAVLPASLSVLQFNCAVTIVTGNATALFTLTDFSADLQ